LVVNRKVIERGLAAELPFMATEEILMAAAKKGGDRQRLHERLRQLSMEAARRVKEDGERNDLLDRIASDPNFASVRGELPALADAGRFVGRAPEQVDEFLAGVVEPILAPVRSQLSEVPPVEV
jgi:adenylosuccinate lyase